MPIYEYRCGDCGHELEALQKMSDPKLTTCPACGAEALTKLVSASAFVLKGSGWYVTDFRDRDKAGGKGGDDQGKTAKDDTAASGTGDDSGGGTSSGEGGESKPEGKSEGTSGGDKGDGGKQTGAAKPRQKASGE